MKTIIISASMRGESQSLKVAHWLDRRSVEAGHKSQVLDLHARNLPMFTDQDPSDDVKMLLAELEAAEAYVFVSPEWNGMMSHGLINMLHYVKHQMAYKPVMLVGVSSGRGGAYPVEQMKILGQKNRHYVVSPENLVVSGVEHAFMDDSDDENAPDHMLKKRASYGLSVLFELASALKQVRASGVVDLENFPNGV